MSFVSDILNKIFKPYSHGDTIHIDSSNPELCNGTPITILRLENDEQKKEWDNGYDYGINWAVDNCKPNGNAPMPTYSEEYDIMGSFGRGWQEGFRCASGKISEKYWQEKWALERTLLKKYAGIEFDYSDPIKKEKWCKNIQDFHEHGEQKEGYNRYSKLYYKGELIGILYDDADYKWHLEEALAKNKYK